MYVLIVQLLANAVASLTVQSPLGFSNISSHHASLPMPGEQAVSETIRVGKRALSVLFICRFPMVLRVPKYTDAVHYVYCEAPNKLLTNFWIS